MTTQPDRAVSFFHVLKFFPVVVITLGAVGAVELPADADVLAKIEKALHNSAGYRFEVKWSYSALDDSWEGHGTMFILGSEYLELILPYQTILIQESTIMTHYAETDQVIIDHFGRKDLSSFFSILLGDFSGFVLQTVTRIDDNKVHLGLAAETLVGFDRLDITVNSSDWLPVSISGGMGNDAHVAVTVESVSILKNAGQLMSKSLQGREIIDLR